MGVHPVVCDDSEWTGVGGVDSSDVDPAFFPETFQSSEFSTIIIGLGSEIACDDSVGVMAARRLRERLRDRSDVNVVELPWAGLRLLPALRGYRCAILIDSLRSGRHPPGTVVGLSEDDLAGSVRLNSFHDLNYPTAIALGRAVGWAMPDTVEIFAVEGKTFDRFGIGLTPPVAEGLDRVVALVVSRLADDGVQAMPNCAEVIHARAETNLQAVPPEAGGFDKTEQELRQAFLSEVDRIPGGERLRQCIQCGTCTGSCPVSYAMDLTPREVLALFRAGDIDRRLRSRTIWVCASCYQCTTRCPSKIKVTDLLYALKRVAVDTRVFPPKFPVYVLSETFADQVKKYGRNYEAGLLRTYFFKTGMMRMFKQIGLAKALWKRGRLALRPERIKGIDGLRKMIERAEAFDQPQAVAAGDKLTREVGYEAIG